MNYQSLAFFTGFFGSLHCIVMCGPLVMAMPFRGNAWHSAFQKLIYQFGRIFTYAILGLLAGSLGSVFNILGLQQAISFVSGIILLLIAYYQFTGKTGISTKPYQTFITPLLTLLGRLMGKSYGGLFAGMLHGLIPCGMVYMAIAGSLNVGSALKGSEFMLYFGLGTTPLLMLSSFIPLALRRFRTPRLLIASLFAIGGLFLIVRSLNLDIPFVSSPVLTKEEAVC